MRLVRVFVVIYLRPHFLDYGFEVLNFVVSKIFLALLRGVVEIQNLVWRNITIWLDFAREIGIPIKPRRQDKLLRPLFVLRSIRMSFIYLDPV